MCKKSGKTTKSQLFKRFQKTEKLSLISILALLHTRKLLAKVQQDISFEQFVKSEWYLEVQLIVSLISVSPRKRSHEVLLIAKKEQISNKVGIIKCQKGQ